MSYHACQSCILSLDTWFKPKLAMILVCGLQNLLEKVVPVPNICFGGAARVYLCRMLACCSLAPRLNWN